MRMVLLYESMYGSTRRVAEAIAEGAAFYAEVSLVAAGEAGPTTLAGADLVVVGGPTHAHGMTSRRTRAAAVDAAAKPASALTVEPGAAGPGLREWFDATPSLPIGAAAFDTRVRGPAVVMGRASKGIARRLTARGAELVVGPESFLVDSKGALLPGEAERARQWGVEVVRAAVAHGLKGELLG